MGRSKISIDQDRLEKLYHAKGFSPKRIGEIFGCDGITIRNRLKEFGIPLKAPAIARMRYKKMDFDGNLILKAYMIGFRLGDLNVYVPGKRSHTLVVRCHTTQNDQVRVMKSLFAPYGKVTAPLKNGHYQVNCFLNRTFDFLIPKADADLLWLKSRPETMSAFVAGYIDAEGNFLLNQGKARFKVDSYDLRILAFISTWLHDQGIINRWAQIYRMGDEWKGTSPLNKDLWRINVNERSSLERFITLLMPYARHRKRMKDMNACLINIRLRTKNGQK